MASPCFEFILIRPNNQVGGATGFQSVKGGSGSRLPVQFQVGRGSRLVIITG